MRVAQALSLLVPVAAGVASPAGWLPTIHLLPQLIISVAQPGRVLGGRIWVSGFHKPFLEMFWHIFSVWHSMWDQPPCPSLCILPAPGECHRDSKGGSDSPREWVGRRLQGTDRAGMFSVSSCFLLHRSEYFIWLHASSLNLKIAGFLPGEMEQFAFSRFFTQISCSTHTQ